MLDSTTAFEGEAFRAPSPPVPDKVTGNYLGPGSHFAEAVQVRRRRRNYWTGQGTTPRGTQLPVLQRAPRLA